MYWSTSSGRIELNITKAQAATVLHPGDCHLDICALLRNKRIRSQVDKLDRALVRSELKEYGAWDDAELAYDHEANLQRLVWIAASDIAEGAQ